MQFDPNYCLNYNDPIALSMINSFWEQPQYPVQEINYPTYYGQRYTPYNYSEFQQNQTRPDSHASLPYESYPIYYPQQFDHQVSYQMSPSSDSQFSFESKADTTISIVDTPPVEYYKIEIIDPADSLSPINENDLNDVLEVIDITSPVKKESAVHENGAKIKDTPVKAKNYVCTACDKFFINRPGLRKHFKTEIHKKTVKKKGVEDPVKEPMYWVIGDHKCFVCNKGFQKHSDMIDHVITH